MDSLKKQATTQSFKTLEQPSVQAPQQVVAVGNNRIDHYIRQTNDYIKRIQEQCADPDYDVEAAQEVLKKARDLVEEQAFQPKFKGVTGKRSSNKKGSSSNFTKTTQKDRKKPHKCT